MWNFILIAGGIFLFMKLIRIITSSLTNEKVWTYYAATPNPEEDNRYQFRFRQKNGKWRAYIVRTPSYGSRNASSGTAHWLTDNGQRYICINGGDVSTLQSMQSLTMTWADRTQRYIRTGISMNSP